MKNEREILKTAFGRSDEQFERCVQTTINNLMKGMETKPMKKRMTFGMALAAVLVLTLGFAIAASISPVADIFGWFYGENFKSGLLQGDIAPVGQSVTLGDVTYTLTEVTYYNDEEYAKQNNIEEYVAPALYGTGYIKAADGKELVLIPEDYQLTDAAGYLVYYADDEVIPDDAKSYAELANEKGCKLVLPKLVPNGFLLGNELVVGDIGVSYMPQKDGSIQFLFEIYGGVVFDESGENVLREQPLERAENYTLSLYIGNWEVAPDGTWLRDEPNNTWLKDDWIVTVTTK